MTAQFSQYFIQTGKFLCKNECPDDQLPPEGPLFEGSPLAVLHGSHDLNTMMFVDGAVVPIARGEMDEKEREQLWFDFRSTRVRLMSPYDFMFLSDYPVPTDPAKLAFYNDEKQRRHLSRTIRETTDDPKEAMRILKGIWENTNVE